MFVVLSWGMGGRLYFDKAQIWKVYSSWEQAKHQSCILNLLQAWKQNLLLLLNLGRGDLNFCEKKKKKKERKKEKGRDSELEERRIAIERLLNRVPAGVRRKNFFSSVNFQCWLLFSARSPSVLLQWHVNVDWSWPKEWNWHERADLHFKKKGGGGGGGKSRRGMNRRTFKKKKKFLLREEYDNALFFKLHGFREITLHSAVAPCHYCTRRGETWSYFEGQESGSIRNLTLKRHTWWLASPENRCYFD